VADVYADNPKELQISRLAARQHGLITTRQLLRCGLSPSGISDRVNQGRLVRVHRGVYFVGAAALSRDARFHAAVLAVGDDAVLSHIAAAALWGFWSGTVDPVDVTVARDVRSRPGIRVHCVSEVPRADITGWHGIPVTTPAHTILDLAATLKSHHAFSRVVHEAEVQGRTHRERLRLEIARHPTHHGRARLAAEIADGPKPARSDLEVRILSFLRRHNFPPFLMNTTVPGLPTWIEVDFLFPGQRVVIEADGARFHDTKLRRASDRRKQAVLEAAGLQVIRLRHEDVEPALEQQTRARVTNALSPTAPIRTEAPRAR
jgi:very-short-patch-repair endonuclease